MFNFGGDKSSSSSKMDQRVYEPQGAALEDVYAQGGNLYQQMMPYANMGFGMIPGMEQYMQQAMQMGQQGAAGQLGGGAYGDTSRYNDMIYNAMANPQQSNTSKMYQDIIGGAGNTYADPLVDAMRTGMNENRMTANNQNALGAANMGQGGSNRHAMTNAMNDRSFNQDMNAAEMGIREGNYARDMDWKMGIANMADDNRQADLNRAQQMVSGANSAQQMGMNYMPTMQNLGMGQMAPWMQAMQMPWMNMQNYANVVGDPTVLSSGKSDSDSWGFDLGVSGGS